MVPVEGDLRPWPPAGGETSVGPPGRHLAVIAMIEVTAATLAAHPFLHGMPPEHLAMLAQAASDATFPAGHRFFEDGGHATCFWLVQSGHVTVDVDVPGQGRVPIGTIGMGELMGWSWLFPPFMWAFGAVAASPVENLRIRRASGTGPACLRPGARLRGDPASRGSAHPAPEVHEEQTDHRLYAASRDALRKPARGSAGQVRGMSFLPGGDGRRPQARLQSGDMAGSASSFSSVFSARRSSRTL